MIGQWIRLIDALLIDELGWHRIAEAAEIVGDPDKRWRLDLGCHVVVLVNPKTLERGLPGAGSMFCVGCANASFIDKQAKNEREASVA